MLLINSNIIIVLLFLSFLKINTCSKNSSLDSIKATEVWQYNSVMGEQFYRTFKFDSIIVLQTQFKSFTFEDQLQIDSINNELKSNKQLVSADWNYDYFIYHKDSSFGYKYIPSIDILHVRLSVDSILQFINGTNRFDSFIALKPDTIVWNNKKTELKEVYKLSNPSLYQSGRLVLYYNKNLNHVKEYINSDVDRLKNMKFYKQETFINSAYNEVTGNYGVSMKDVTELREVEIPIPSEVMDFIKMYKKEGLQSK